jgi:hypothetical protein
VLVLAAIEREFLAAVRLQTSRGRRRKALVIAAIFAALGIAIAGGTVAFIQVSRANADAQHKASDANRAREQAQAAEAKVQKQLDDVNAAQAAKDRAEREQRAAEAKAHDAEGKAHDAEGKAQVFEGEAKLSRTELEQRNGQLGRALSDARAEKTKAVVATEVANTANAMLEETLARERERIKQLEQEKSKIYSGGLK